ncbi:hypothetical protein Tco_1051600, partial [Tanacetum coccineum]
MHYSLWHPGQGVLGPAPAIYASQLTTLPSAFSTMPLQDPTWHMDTEPGDGVTSHTRRRHNSSSDGVTSFMMASASTDSNADLEDSSYDDVMTKTRRRRV